MASVFFSILALTRPAEAILNSRVTAPELPPGLQAFHDAPTNLASLRGKVVLLFFWTSSSYESLNHLAFLNDIHVTYKDEGLAILALHVPKKETEKDPVNITKLLNRYHLYIPVLHDTQDAAARTYFATDIPWILLIDRQGRLRTTLMPPLSQTLILSRIQDLIAESSGAPLDPWPKDLIRPLDGPFSMLKFNLGYQDLAFFGNAMKVRSEEVQAFEFPNYIQPNLFYIQGTWRFQPQLAEILSDKAGIRFYFQGSVLSLVAEAPANETREIIIRLDQQPLSKEIAGPDIQRNGDNTVLKITEPRIYFALSLPAPLKDAHEVELEISGGMTYFYSMTASDMPLQLSVKKSEEGEAEDQELTLTTSLEDV